MTPDVLWWVLAGLLTLAGVLIVGIVCTPVRIGAAFDNGAKPAFGFKLAVFGGYLPLVNTIGKASGDRAKSMERAKSKDSAEEKTQDASAKARKSGRPIGAAQALRMLRAAPELVCRIFARVKIEAADADIAFGLPDPADTGMIYGALSPFAHLAGGASKIHLTLRPDFHDAGFTGCGRAAARFTPIALVPPMLGFGWAVYVAPRFSGAFK